MTEEVLRAIHNSTALIMGQASRNHSDVMAALGFPTEPEVEPTWRDSEDLIDPAFKPVLGIHTGGDSDPEAIALQMGRKIQAAPIYWKKATSPYQVCQKKLAKGTLPRLELCLPHIFTNTGARMPTEGSSFWARAGQGEYDWGITQLVTEVGLLDTPILLSMGHESDLRSEDGASPKNSDPPQSDYCGKHEDFGGYWERFATLARQYAPKARLFLNFSGGFSDAGERWSTMLPPAGTFDFFGWDPYSQYGKNGSTDWQDFGERFEMFGRWDWYRETIPDVPIIVGETGVCEHKEPTEQRNAGRWLLDMIDYMVDHKWNGVGTGGGISQIHYFSHHYDAHPRCLDDDGSHHNSQGCDSRQRFSVLPQIGADERLSWA